MPKGIIAGAAGSGGGASSWTLLDTIDLTGESASHDFKTSGDTTIVSDEANTYTLDAQGHASSSNYDLIAETSGGAADGSLQFDCNSTSADYFPTTYNAPQMQIALTPNLDIAPGDIVSITLTGTMPAFSANAGSPAMTVGLEFRSSTNTQTFVRYSHPAGGWATRTYTSTSTSWSGTTLGDVTPTSPLSTGFQVLWYGSETAAAWADADHGVTGAAWDVKGIETVEDGDEIILVLSTRRGAAGVTTASTLITIETIEIRRLRPT